MSDQTIIYTILGVVFAAVLLAVAWWLYILLYVNKKVERTSKRIKCLKQINEGYSEKFQRIISTEELTYRLNSKQKFDHFKTRLRFNEAVAENQEDFKERLEIANQNAKYWEQYSTEMNELPKTQYDKRVYIKAEARLIGKESLPKPVTNPKVKLDWSYTSPQGQNHYENCRTFNKSDIEDALKVAKSKTTRQAQISAERAAMTPALRYKVLERDNFRCQICGSTANDGVQLHVDHIYPVSKGGKTELSNLRTLCDRCNMGKGTRIEEKKDK